MIRTAIRADFQPPETLDFRRDNRKGLMTIITVHADYQGRAWTHTGDVNIVGLSNSNRPSTWMVEAKNHGATDFEHDTARPRTRGLQVEIVTGRAP